MKCYKVYPGDYPTHDLTRYNFEDDTCKCQPHYSRSGHFAVCPCCDNPIKIINLYFSDNYYAKHYLADVPGLADFNPEAYEKCLLRGKNARMTNQKTRLAKIVKVS